MNILHITTFLQGGAGKIIKELAMYQSKNNKVCICTSIGEDENYCNYNDYLEELRGNKIEVKEIKSSFKRDLYLNFNFSYNIKEILEQGDIDIIHCHAAIPILIAKLATDAVKKKIPIISTMHGWGENKSVDQEKMDTYLLNISDKTITVSNSDKKLLISKGVHSGNIITIYNGIEEEENFTKDKISKFLKQLKSKYKVIGCIGTVCERKNQKLIIDAIKLMDGTKGEFAVVFMGEGKDIEYLEEVVNNMGLEDRIFFLGNVKKAAKYIKLFDIFSLPSKSEGFGLAIVEAFREKVLTVISDIDVFKEVAGNETCIFFENNNVYSLKEKIELTNNISKKERDNFINNAYEKYKNSYSLEKMLMEYDKLYSEVKIQ